VRIATPHFVRRTARRQPRDHPCPGVDLFADDVPLTEVEVRAALDSASRENLSGVRRIAAVLDVFGEPMASI